MTPARRPLLLVFLITVSALLAVTLFWWLGQQVVQPYVHRPKVSPPQLSPLASVPDWKRLDAWQGTLSRPQFEDLLGGIFTARDGWRKWIEVDLTGATVKTHRGPYRIEFGAGRRDVPAARYWRRPSEFSAAPVGRPLQGLHVAIDPGHIGGSWAQMEERWLVIDDNPPICEGDMTLQVGRLMKQRLEALGARVTLVREGSQPVTDKRPEDFMAQALAEEPDELRARRVAERWFYRTAEIRARADKVNRKIQPDLVLALHFNAESWGHAERPRLVDHSHVHMLVHGGYGDDELAFEDQRHEMLLKLLSGTHREEAALARSMMEVFSAVTGLPSFDYSPQNRYVSPVPGAKGVWARNLLANRLYDCPVVYLEPYLMNSRQDAPRMLAGDYVGLREVGGKLQVSIFREYAEAACAALVRDHSARRGR